MKKISIATVVLALGALIVPSAMAQPQIHLAYDYVDIGGGRFEYEFELSVDDRWTQGMGWRWFIFGDIANNQPSPLTNFVGDPNDLPIGPWTAYTSSGGGHNGPTLGFVLAYWIPQSQDEKLNWSGTSTAALDEPALLYSTLAGTVGGATAADFTPASQGLGGPTCVYTLKKSKAKKCDDCPAEGSDYGTEAECEDVGDCAKKIRTTIACPGGGDGKCKLKGKRSDCA
ncbi:MAG: hypothetical protein C4547_04285 [Phycisphaerales bacterium]|nr:MAG: hypothetical protein C4547_04285 [Phycisphaerales bacterium]